MNKQDKIMAVARSIIDGPLPADDQFETATIILLSGWLVAIELVKSKRIGTLRAADLLFDLRRSLSELEKEFVTH